MKKSLFGFLILLLLAIPIFGFAEDQPLSKSLNFSWEQDNPEYITGWSLYWTPTAGSGYVKVVDIPYITGAGPTFTTSTILAVTGTPGATETRYFVLTATGKNVPDSAYSNEATYAFLIPFPTPSAPFNLIITVTVQ